MSPNEQALENLMRGLDISPSDFNQARDRYKGVGDWLSSGTYNCGDTVDVYLQGSFKLGTVIRPFSSGQDADFDIDQVCEISGRDAQPKTLKHDVGDRLKEHATYAGLLDDEGRRCWTLQYASAVGRPGFHIDVLPSRPRVEVGMQIDITHQDAGIYRWHRSSPKGYAEWFSVKNDMGPEFVFGQRKAIYDAYRSLYASVEDVPEQLVRTSLQRAIQLMKRHRDVAFDGRDGAPISMIITTICAHLYRGGGILPTVRNFVEYVASRHEEALKGVELVADDILDYRRGCWVVRNPAEPAENFAERWEHNRVLAENFFSWVYQLRRDLTAYSTSDYPPDLGLFVRGTPKEGTAYGVRLVEGLSAGSVNNSDDFLNLIHMGIEGRVAWPVVREIAQRNVNEATGAERDVALVNRYQVTLHSGYALTEENQAELRRMLNTYADRPDYVLCCSLLRGTATTAMLKNCLRYATTSDVLSWPILRLPSARSLALGSAVIPMRKFASYGRN